MLLRVAQWVVAVGVSLACPTGSLPVARRLYLPREWADDGARPNKAGVPQEVEFAIKPAIALSQIEPLMSLGAPRHFVLADTGYGVDTPFRGRLSELGLTHWRGREGPSHGEAAGARAAAVRSLRRPRCGAHAPAFGRCGAAAPTQWQTLEWREGTNVTLRPRFARVRGFGRGRSLSGNFDSSSPMPRCTQSPDARARPPHRHG
jgi:SRSO17 transposase